MDRLIFFLNLCLLQTFIGPSVAADELPPAVDRPVDFVLDVEPLLSQHCWSCHGQEKQESGLRLDRRDAMLVGGDLGKVVVMGDSSASRLVHYVNGTNSENVMPPDGERLSGEQIGILRAWIDQGAAWPESDDLSPGKNDHWAYQSLSVAMLPDVSMASWPENDIDRFVLAALEKQSISPSPEADRYTLIRRLSLDLTGLLPSIEEVDAFVNDRRNDAYERLVDRLLASPHFGERWGRHWLDMARYADSDGYEKDNPRPDAYRWRDWVIDSINSDMPFDQFTIEQLAGDLIPDASPMQKLATAFHRQTLTNTEGGTDQEQFRVEACFDRTETTGTVWLGLTIGCARCHTHKYDAITQREYYQLFAVFNNGDEATITVPKSDAEVEAYAVARAAYDQEYAELAAALKLAQEQQRPAFVEWQNHAKGVLDASSDPVKLHSLERPQYRSEPGVVFEEQRNGAVLVGGENPERGIYTVEGQTSITKIDAIRLDVLADKSLPSNGPGRVVHGNFVLNEVTMEIATSADFADARQLEFATAKADFEQTDRPWLAKHVIDGKEETGWAIAPQFGKDHWLLLGLQRPLTANGPIFVRVRLHQQYGKQHTIGRFKLSLQTGIESDDLMPKEIAAALKTADKNRSEKQNELLLNHFSRQTPGTKELIEKLDQLKKKEPAKPELPVRAFVQRPKDPRKTFVLRRGEFLMPVADLEVQPAGLATLPAMATRVDSAMGDRMDLARWLVSPDNPLTPRVTVNHVWRLLFGYGIVRTSNDFGIGGDRPTHPELLDWLAADFLQGSGTDRPWSRKALIKRIVLSATYRQSSRRREELSELDPQNLLLARQNRLRVEGEIVRDISLDVSGLLSRKIGGPSVYPALPSGIAELSYAGNFKWTVSEGEDRYRRGMYTFFKRTSPHPNLITFDCPDANIACIERQTSNTPLQALTSLNNESFAEAARAFGMRLLATESPDDVSRLKQSLRLCVSRPGTAVEFNALQGLLDDSRVWYQSHPEQAVQLSDGQSKSGVSTEEMAAWIAVSRVLLNLDEFITRE